MVGASKVSVTSKARLGPLSLTTYISVVRLLVSIPLVIATSILLGNYLIQRNYIIVDSK